MLGNDVGMSDTVQEIERELAEAGRDRSSFRITAIVITAIGDDLDTIRAPLAPMLSTFPQDTAGYLARGVVDGEALVKAAADGGPFAVMKMWTPDLIDQIAMVTTPDGLGDALARYAATGVDEVALMFLLTEATKQLRGECGDRQVPGAQLACVHGTGGTLGVAHSGATLILGADS